MIPLLPRRVGWGIAVVGLLGALAVPVARNLFRADPGRLLAQAQADFRAGRLGRAEEGLERLGRLRAPTPLDRMARAQVAWARGGGAVALAELARIPDDDPLARLAWLMAGQIEMQSGRLGAAEARFLATLEREPDAVQAHRELAYLASLRRRLPELDAHLHALSELGALDFKQALHWSKTRNAIWSPSKDCEVLAKAVAADPGDLRSRLALAEALRVLSRVDEARQTLGPLPDSDPDARALRASLALDRGDQERALDLLAEGPADHPALARLRGLSALSRGDARGAVVHLRAALAADRNDRSVLFGLGSALKRLGAEEEARPYLEAARRHDALTPLLIRASVPAGEKDSKTPSRLGAACEEAGRPLEALAWYRLAVARDPLDSGAQQGIFRLVRSVGEGNEAAPVVRGPGKGAAPAGRPEGSSAFPGGRDGDEATNPPTGHRALGPVGPGRGRVASRRGPPVP